MAITKFEPRDMVWKKNQFHPPIVKVCH